MSREIEGELEEVKRRLGEKEIQVEKEKSEKKRLQTLLGQTRSSETALISEVKECVLPSRWTDRDFLLIQFGLIDSRLK